MWWTRAQVGVLLISNVIISQPTHAAPTNYRMQQSAKYYQPLIRNQLTTSSYRAAALLSLLLDISSSLLVAFLCANA
jgi:hypothetical protein